MLEFVILFFILGLIGAAIWPTPDPYAHDYTDKVLGIGKYRKRHKGYK